MERFCARLHTCQNIAATMDYGACVDRYQSLSDEPCMECIGGLTCAGLEEALINGRNLCEAECGPM